jgi:hypothetical protein
MLICPTTSRSVSVGANNVNLTQMLFIESIRLPFAHDHDGPYMNG